MALPDEGTSRQMTVVDVDGIRCPRLRASAWRANWRANCMNVMRRWPAGLRQVAGRHGATQPENLCLSYLVQTPDGCLAEAQRTAATT
jgi:hypothetical protein